MNKAKNLITVQLIALVTATTISLTATAQEVINLYSGNIPNAKNSVVKEAKGISSDGVIRKVTTPTLEVYLPDRTRSNGTAIIICPGGSYKVLVYQGEGIAIAKEFVKRGVAAFVLKYRLPNDSILIDKKIGPLQDALQAIKLVRENAHKWGIDVNKVGVIGFSAGGHLASSLATHYSERLIENNSKINLRPDFQILIYPVISMQDSLTHFESRTNLLGKNPAKGIIDHFSNESMIDTNTPPAYIIHAADDKVVDVDNSIAYFEGLRHHKVPVELHIYPEGDHGFIFKRAGWMQPLFEWMKNYKWIDK
jgi:acetyl esterase/lipase